MHLMLIPYLFITHIPVTGFMDFLFGNRIAGWALISYEEIPWFQTTPIAALSFLKMILNNNVIFIM